MVALVMNEFGFFLVRLGFLLFWSKEAILSADHGCDGDHLSNIENNFINVQILP
jgi:hypothetical protein